jgi:hypothetical protein
MLDNPDPKCVKRGPVPAYGNKMFEQPFSRLCYLSAPVFGAFFRIQLYQY